MCVLPQKVRLSTKGINLIKHYGTTYQPNVDSNILNLVGNHLSGVISSVLIRTKIFLYFYFLQNE